MEFAEAQLLTQKCTVSVFHLVLGVLPETEKEAKIDRALQRPGVLRK